MKKKYILLLLFFLAFGKMQSQDAQFSMYQYVPTIVNPAFAGLAPGQTNNRLTTSYRSQWLKPFGQPAYQTIFAGYDFRICPLPCDPGEVKLFGLGLNLSHDRSGASPLQRSQAIFQFSFSQTLFPDILLAFGAEGGAIFHQFGNGQLFFDEQFVNGAYDNTVSGEDFDQNGFTMEDLGAGLALYSAGIGTGKDGFSAGLSFKHITRPEYRFFEQNQDIKAKLPMRTNVHGRAHLKIKNGVATDVRILLMKQSVYEQLLVGLDGVWLLQKKQTHMFNMTFGAAWRRSRYLDSGWHNDALVTSASLYTDAMRFSISYDLSLSKTQQEQNRGAFELGLQFFWGTKKDCWVDCPVGL